MHRRGGHRPAGTASSVDSKTARRWAPGSARLKSSSPPLLERMSLPSHFPSLGQADSRELAAGTLHGHTRPQRPPLTDRPHYYTPHHHFPTSKLRKHKPSTRCAQLGPLCGWLQSRSCAPLARVALCPPTCATSIALQRGGGTDARCPMAASRRRQPRCHMEGCRWLLTLTLSSLRCARAKPARVVSSRDRSAAPSSHRDGSCRDACSASLGMMVAGCERLPSSASAQYPPILVPCLSTCMPSLWGGVVFVRRQSPTLPTGSVTSHINDTPREKGKPSHLPDPPAGCRSLFLITPRSLGQRSRAVAPYRPSLTRWTRKPPSAAWTATNRRRARSWIVGGPFLPGSGLDRLFSRTS